MITEMKFVTTKVVFLALALLSGFVTAAQAPQKNNGGKPSVSNTPKQKSAVPVAKTIWGKYTGSNNVVAAAEAKALLALPLKITDEKNVSYQLHSYQFGYRRRGVTENEETGAVTPQTDMVIQLFKTTPLPELWQNNIGETLHKDEELYFFDVIVYDKNGKLFFAPELKIVVQ
jgi:hypothetical protein